MSKYFKDNGFLSEDGKKLVQPVHDSLMEVLTSKEVRHEMSEAEIMTLGSNLAKAVGDHISELLFAKRQPSNQYTDMSDEQFEAHLKAKYGDKWMLVALTKEEFARLPKPSDEEIKEAWQKGIQDREAYLKNAPSLHIDPGLRFK